MSTLISIIIPVYNVERFIERCVDSVLTQTFNDFELILVDDGSSDRSGEICDGYAQLDNRVKVVHKKNGGVSTARNYGLDIAKGRYICFIDSDDWIDSTYLDDFKIREYVADIYMSGALYDIDNRLYSYKKYESIYIKNRVEIEAEFTRQNLWQNGYPWGKLYRTDIIQRYNIRFDERLSIHEDHIFVFEYYTHIENLYMANSAGYHYLVVDGTTRKLSSKVNSYGDLKKASERFSVVLDVLSNYLGLCEDNQATLYNSFVIGCRANALSSIFLAKNYETGRYEDFESEVEYWRQQNLHNIPLNRFNKVVLSIVVKFRPILLCYFILLSIYTIKSTIFRKGMNAILQDLQSRSIVVK